jgi:hypothetical protein
MRILRHRHTLAFITLLAFAMQGVIALAHTHVHTGAPGPLAAASVQKGGLATRAITYGLCRPDAARPCPPPAEHDDHNCPICWSVNLAGTAVFGVPPAVPLLKAPKAVPAPLRIAALLLDAARIHFRARAPPHAAA